jgi:hypothetical protein
MMEESGEMAMCRRRKEMDGVVGVWKEGRWRDLVLVLVRVGRPTTFLTQ